MGRGRTSAERPHRRAHHLHASGSAVDPSRTVAGSLFLKKPVVRQQPLQRASSSASASSSIATTNPATTGTVPCHLGMTSLSLAGAHLAADARDAADELTDPEAKVLLLSIAQAYERLARRAEERKPKKEQDDTK